MAVPAQAAPRGKANGLRETRRGRKGRKVACKKKKGSKRREKEMRQKCMRANRQRAKQEIAKSFLCKFIARKERMREIRGARKHMPARFFFRSRIYENQRAILPKMTTFHRFPRSPFNRVLENMYNRFFFSNILLDNLLPRIINVVVSLRIIDNREELYKKYKLIKNWLYRRF